MEKKVIPPLNKSNFCILILAMLLLKVDRYLKSKISIIEIIKSWLVK